ncbi:MAG: RNA-binding protein [Chloroflexaceae bacterium]|nr:RNA-binding protein [Chloroflexaceae bacterium]
MSVRLYVGNLPKEPIDRQELQSVFADAGGDQMATKVIKDRKTGKCRGFAFVTVPTDEIADALIEKYNGQSFMESPLRIEKAMPRTKGKKDEDGEDPQESPTPVAVPVTAAAAEIQPKAAGRRNNKKKGRTKGDGTKPETSDSFQPDPRWAGELAKLKEMLQAQASNS